LSRLLERVERWNPRLYCTDDWAAYGELIPQGRLHVGKEETHGIERDHSRQRHWPARFRRRTCVVSKAERMVDASIALFVRFGDSAGIGELLIYASVRPCVIVPDGSRLLIPTDWTEAAAEAEPATPAPGIAGQRRLLLLTVPDLLLTRALVDAVLRRSRVQGEEESDGAVEPEPRRSRAAAGDGGLGGPRRASTRGGHRLAGAADRQGRRRGERGGRS